MSSTFRLKCLLCTGFMLGVLYSVPLYAQRTLPDLTELSLEELMNITVTSVSKREEKLSDATAAIYAITAEDLTRSGATSIPEALRLVPGMHVAQIDANKWSIGARGFNGRFANKLLVLIDGRSVYSPLFSGVHWDVQDVHLQDIQRIEVIRGPGATLWGANAVNGVINIITRPAQETRGGLLTARVGSEIRGLGSARYGAGLGRRGHYRMYIKADAWDNAVAPANRAAADRWRMVRGGGRFDWTLSARDAFTVQGDLYDGDLHQTVTLPSRQPPYTTTVLDPMQVRGGNVLTRWNRTLSPRSRLALQFYLDRTFRRNVLHRETRHIIDMEVQHDARLGNRHEVVWGLGYRLTKDAIASSATVSFAPSGRAVNLANVFVQDQLSLIDRTLSLTLGSKFEYNQYTHLEIQPNARLLWTPYPRHSGWAAVSRAVRTPSRAEEDVTIEITAFPGPGGVTNLVTVRGNPRFQAERLLAYEGGYRYQVSDHLSVDVVAFYNVYDALRTVEPAGPPVPDTSTTPPVVVIPLQFNNLMNGKTYGAEMAGIWHPVAPWTLHLGYAWFSPRLRVDPASQDVTSPRESDDYPRHQFQARSSLNLPYHLALDAMLFYVGKLPNQNVPGYVRLDTRIGWTPRPVFSLSAVVQNMLDAHHPEFGNTPLGEAATEVQRGGHFVLSWHF